MQPKHLLFFVLFPFLLGCENPSPGNQVFISEGYSSQIVNGYWIYLPRNYNPDKKWPVILFLQGGHGVGPDNRTSKNNGPAKYAMIASKNELTQSLVSDTFIIINPHMKTGPKEKRQWFQFPKQIDRLVNDVISKYSGDSNRIYLTGLSRGGHGSWGIAKRVPNRFAAIVPIAGRLNCKTECEPLADLPKWVIHNTGDEIVEYQNSESTVNTLEEDFNHSFLKTNDMRISPGQINQKHIFTSFQTEGHDAWSEAYRSPELYEWLLQWRREF